MARKKIEEIQSIDYDCKEDFIKETYKPSLVSVNIKLLTPTAKVPLYANNGDACFDFYADETVEFRMGELGKTVGTGLSVEVPEGYVLLIFPRSGMSKNSPLRLSNCVGVIDSGYRGEVKVLIDNIYTNAGKRYILVNKGDRIAQGMIIPRPNIIFNIVDNLSESNRGVGGFGSTGK